MMADILYICLCRTAIYESNRREHINEIWYKHAYGYFSSPLAFASEFSFVYFYFMEIFLFSEIKVVAEKICWMFLVFCMCTLPFLCGGLELCRIRMYIDWGSILFALCGPKCECAC